MEAYRSLFISLVEFIFMVVQCYAGERSVRRVSVGVFYPYIETLVIRLLGKQRVERHI